MLKYFKLFESRAKKLRGKMIKNRYAKILEKVSPDVVTTLSVA